MKNEFLYKCILILAGLFILPMAGQSKQEAALATTPNIAAANEAQALALPLAAESYHVSAAYGEQIHPLTQNMRFHRGIDLAAKMGTTVLSPADGTVKTAVSDSQEVKGWGKHIEIEHANGFATVYTHLSQVFVQEGQVVKQGERIGAVGSTGKSTGPHLHFEVWKDGEHVNPAEYLSF